MTMVDIQGVEDFFGDMDFKVAGTHKGITAIQLDLKNDGLTYDIIKEALDKCYKARIHILDDVMLKAIDKPRAELSKYAPKMLTMMIDVEKISDVIGKGGKVIQKICAECEVKIDVEEDGHVFVSSTDIENAERAITIIETIVRDPEPGAMYYGKVTRILPIGAMVEIAPGKEGLVHISKLENRRVEKTEDEVSIGDIIPVKVLKIDERGRVDLSRKDAMEALNAKKANEQE
jgi:polyribonucleotide nucleotidyltransferase